MNNFKKTLDNQQKINEATNAIFHHLKNVANFSSHYVCMSKAQTNIMVMATQYRNLLAQHKGELDYTYDEDITEFMWLTSQVFDLIKPFASMIGQVYGEEND